ncbi:conserved Plasmodium protein, unknown function [Plasmodium gallinaceum]|uniref:Uncharacterized protein n=1 Tax=Plasmodium gallinaceum TaxID=5849 RepID=A0A1J1GLD3_PLAGA|nr:conserved Plasmodium protein, unknown function [Plasmodium gallinaceum]CRG93224.1 conserved Plasmodium protein, unknown function [Plasmodium gallinaceum]
MNISNCRSVEKIFDDSTFNKIERKKLEFDNKKLNNFFENGIINYSLVEIIGNCGSGKTQFALTLCAEHLLKIFDINKNINDLNLKNKENIIFYIYINRMFPIHRLIEIIEKKIQEKENNQNKCYVYEDIFKDNNLHNNTTRKNNSNNNCSSKNSFDEKQFNYSFKRDLRGILRNLYIQKINDEKDLFILFEKDIFYILKYYKISLLIIDSINSIFNANQKLDNYKKNQLFIKISLILKKISYENNFFVLLINSLYIKKEYNDFSFNIADFIISSSCANTILFFKKIKKKNEIIRKIIIHYSEFLSKYKTLKFEITDTGFNVL